eukprot:GHVS01073405.1.p1 GENE.GHVS01073405.1~~GHVS01073405.1.p1  ORF type:complete len:145 (-),score=6.91 GHVS01073405.1:152-586(-)
MRLLFVPFHVTVVLFRVTPSAGHGIAVIGSWICAFVCWTFCHSCHQMTAKTSSALPLYGSCPPAHFISQILYNILGNLSKQNWMGRFGADVETSFCCVVRSFGFAVSLQLTFRVSTLLALTAQQYGLPVTIEFLSGCHLCRSQT